MTTEPKPEASTYVQAVFWREKVRAIAGAYDASDPISRFALAVMDALDGTRYPAERFDLILQAVAIEAVEALKAPPAREALVGRFASFHTLQQGLRLAERLMRERLERS
jgi:hypothetical protein